MVTINLRKYYPWYTQDEFVEVPDVVAAELLVDRRYQKSYERRMRYNKIFSIDEEAEMNKSSIFNTTNSPDVLLEMKERYCRLCRALNALPEIQGRRIEAHYFHGKSQSAIAKSEGVTRNAVNISIVKGLGTMKEVLKSSDQGLNICPFRLL